MQSAGQLHNRILSLSNQSYGAYKSLVGKYRFANDNFILSIDHVQSDPHAPPSNVSVYVDRNISGFPEYCFTTKTVKIAIQDYLIRKFHNFLKKFNGYDERPSISITKCGQQIMERSDCQITDNEIIMRFGVHFPGYGRKINAKGLIEILFNNVPKVVNDVLFYRNHDPEIVRSVVFLAEDQEFIRQEIQKRNIITFIANDSVLPRESGVSQLPMKDCIPFISPESLCIEINTPHKGTIKGMGIPIGITTITGGGYHGKSTLLDAIQTGVYNHIHGDGREYVITDATAIKIRSEDGRFVKDVDLSLFINDLPNKVDTHCFTTLDASGSTSQSASIIEGMESKTKLLLLDEDTSATNLLVREPFMQEVIHRDKEPITPFIERAEDLFTKCGISTSLVAGSSGAFFHISNLILQLDNYRTFDITQRVKPLCEKYPLSKSQTPPFFPPSSHRIYSIHTPVKSYKEFKVKVTDKGSLFIGDQLTDLRSVEQIANEQQTKALGHIMVYARKNLIDNKKTVSEIISILMDILEKDGLNGIITDRNLFYGLAMPREQEIYAAFNRYRR